MRDHDKLCAIRDVAATRVEDSYGPLASILLEAVRKIATIGEPKATTPLQRLTYEQIRAMLSTRKIQAIKRLRDRIQGQDGCPGVVGVGETAGLPPAPYISITDAKKLVEDLMDIMVEGIAIEMKIETPLPF